MLGRKQSSIIRPASIFTFLSILWFYWYYVRHYCKKPRLYIAEGNLKERVKTGVPNLFAPYRPSPWLLNSHLMTIAGGRKPRVRDDESMLVLVIRRFGGDCYEREYLNLPDGGTVGLDWFENSLEEERWKEHTPIVLVMHGLTGGSQEGYCQWMCYAASKQKWRSVVLNYRGCNGVPMTSPKGYTPVSSEDVAYVIQEIKQRFPNAPLFAVAYSLGSLMLCKYLGESDQSGGSQLEAAVMVSNPCCMFSSQKKLNEPWTVPWLFNLVLGYRLRMYADEHQESFKGITTVNVDEVKKCRTIHDFEKATICQLYGFSSLNEYYHKGSSQFHIPNIRTKSLILVAEDDPFIGKLPVDECLKNDNIALAVTSYGGHVAFLQGIWPFSRAWMEDTTLQFFTTFLC